MSDNTKTDIYDEDLDLIETDASTVLTTILTWLERSVSEPLYPGDERRIFGEALAGALVPLYNSMNDAARQVMLRFARGQVLDELGARTDTARLEAKKATTVLRFTVSTPHSTNIVIPKWTKATADGSLYFATDETAVLQAGAYSVDVPASATEGGSKFNGYGVGAIATLTDLVAYIEGVTNIEETAGGDDGEPYTTAGDDHYRERIRLSPAKLSTAGPVGGYSYYAKSADPKICDVSVVSDEAGSVTLIPLLEGGKIPDADVLAAVVKAASADNVRPLTDKVDAKAPVPVEYDIELTYYTTQADEAQVISNVEAPGGAIDQFKAWQAAELGRAINPDYLRKLILSPDWGDSLLGATRVTIVDPEYTELTRRQVAKFSGTIKVSHVIERR